MEPYLFNGAENLDKETASYIISCILPTFCDLVAEEESVLKRRGKSELCGDFDLVLTKLSTI